MQEQHCPHCGGPMLNPFGQMFYCKNDCDLKGKKNATVNEGITTNHDPKDRWFPLSGFKLIDNPLVGSVAFIQNDTGKRLLLKGKNIFNTYQYIDNFRFKKYPDATMDGSFYVGTNHGLGIFFWHYNDPKLQTGFHGTEFSIRMKGGNYRTIKGPFSSRASAVNAIVPEEHKMVDIIVINPYAGTMGQFARQYVTLPFAAYMANKLGLTIYKTTMWSKEPYYVIGE